MDGLSRVMGSAVPVRLDGRVALLWPMRLVDYGTCENLLLSRETTPLQLLAEGSHRQMPGPMFDRLYREAYRETARSNQVSRHRLNEWLDGPEGLCYSVWLGLRRDMPSWGFAEVERAIRLLDDSGRRTLARLRDQASGVDLLATADWPLRDRDESPVKPICWRRVYRMMIEDAQISSLSIPELTIYQAYLILCDKDSVGGRVRMSVAEARAKGILKPKVGV